MSQNDNPSFFKTTTELFAKQIGILLKENDEDPSFEYEVLTKLAHQDSYRKILIKPDYPTIEFPPLIKLLNRDEFKSFDNIRVELLKWIINEEKLARFDLNLMPRNYLQDVLTLTFMCDRKHLTEYEADIMLLSIKKINTNSFSKDMEIPQKINERAFRIAMLFLKFHEMMGRVLEVVGLKDDFSVSSIISFYLTRINFFLLFIENYKL
jgi:hypothetical protein